MSETQTDLLADETTEPTVIGQLRISFFGAKFFYKVLRITIVEKILNLMMMK